MSGRKILHANVSAKQAEGHQVEAEGNVIGAEFNPHAGGFQG